MAFLESSKLWFFMIIPNWYFNPELSTLCSLGPVPVSEICADLDREKKSQAKSWQYWMAVNIWLLQFWVFSIFSFEWENVSPFMTGPQFEGCFDLHLLLKEGLCTDLSSLPIVPVNWKTLSNYSDPSHLTNGLLQCTPNGAALENHLEVIVAPEYGGTDSIVQYALLCELHWLPVSLWR